MTRSIFAASLLSMTAFIAAPHAVADNIADCEIVLMETIETDAVEDESGNGSIQVASYRPAADFIASAYSDEEETISDIDGLAIRALLCSRKDIIISETDFKLLATGIPFVLSQNFDNTESDLMTYFFKDGTFQYSHKGKDLSEEKLLALTARLDDFNEREDVIESLVDARAAKKAAIEANTSKADISDAPSNPDDK